MRSVPWLLDRPLNPWRFIAPAKPLPLETPTTSARSPGLEDVGPELLARLVGRGVVRAELDDVAARLARRARRSDPARAWSAVAAAGLGERELDGLVAVRSASVFTCVTKHGPALMTVTGTARVSS